MSSVFYTTHDRIIGAVIRFLRIKQNMSLLELQRRLRTTNDPTNLVRIEDGNFPLTVHELQKIAAILSIDECDILRLITETRVILSYKKVVIFCHKEDCFYNDWIYMPIKAIVDVVGSAII